MYCSSLSTCAVKTILALALLLLPVARLVQSPAAQPRIGVWYTTWWDVTDRHLHWKDARDRVKKLPSLGIYTSYDPRIIRTQYEQMKECGIDFVIFDDTNTIFVDDGIVDRTIRAWFDFMDALVPSERLKLCVAFGGELNQHQNKEGFLVAADYLWKSYAGRPSYLRLDGKPLALWYIEKDVIPDWNDPRWTIRRCFHAFRTRDQGLDRGWGWGSAPSPPANMECMSFFPGWVLDKPVLERRNGDYYEECWLKALKARPQFVAIADWNNWQEQTAIEDSPAWTDTYGASTPDWYRQITRGYASLRSGKLLQGFYYREEGKPEVYYFNSRRKLVHVPAYPRRKAVIVTPEGWLDRTPKLEWPGKLEP